MKTDNVDRRLLSKRENNSEGSEGVYQAYEVVESPISNVRTLVTQERLEIRQKNESGYVMPYSLVVLTGYMADRSITLFCASYVIIIEGQNLTELQELLLERKVRWIREFDGKRFDTSFTELPEGTPVITEVKVKFGRV